MPYIKQGSRPAIDTLIDELACNIEDRGEFNYAITRLMHHYICKNKKCYNTLNDAMGILNCVSMELYRRMVAPYEDKKIEENGDVKIDMSFNWE